MIAGRSQYPEELVDANFRQSKNAGGMLRHVDLSSIHFDRLTDFRNVFLDGTVAMPDEFRNQMGNPCQWISSEVPDVNFYGRWRGWLEIAPFAALRGTWAFDIAPEGFEDVPPIPPPPGCTWKTGPMPGAAAD